MLCRAAKFCDRTRLLGYQAVGYAFCQGSQVCFRCSWWLHGELLVFFVQMLEMSCTLLLCRWVGLQLLLGVFGQCWAVVVVYIRAGGRVARRPKHVLVPALHSNPCWDCSGISRSARDL